MVPFTDMDHSADLALALVEAMRKMTMGDPQKGPNVLKWASHASMVSPPDDISSSVLNTPVRGFIDILYPSYAPIYDPLCLHPWLKQSQPPHLRPVSTHIDDHFSLTINYVSEYSLAHPPHDSPYINLVRRSEGLL